MNPWIVRKVISPLLEQLMRRNSFRVYRQLVQSQWWPRERLRELQFLKLSDIMTVAFTMASGYAKWAGVDRTWRLRSLEDLSKLPLMDKGSISANREQLVNLSVSGGPIRYTTGGSSGQPLIFYLDKRRQAVDKAARMLTHEWWGIRPGDREAYIWGSPVELSRQDRLKRFRDWLTNDMLLSAFDLGEHTVRPFVERLRRFQPKCLFGYPSSIALMCQLARRAGQDLKGLRARVVFSTAEVLYDHQKWVISEALGGVPVVNGYGSREGGFIAHECPHGRMHIMTPNIIVEFIKDGKPVASSQDGEIVVTHLDNHAMPFIRYRTGDIGQPCDEGCPCGRGFAVMKVLKGRSTDFIVTPDGRWVHGLGLIYVVREVPGVTQYQIVQDDIDLIRVRLVTQAGFPVNGETTIREGIVKRLGQSVRVSVESVDSIPQEDSGKFRYVISHVARDRQALL